VNALSDAPFIPSFPPTVGGKTGGARRRLLSAQYGWGVNPGPVLILPIEGVVQIETEDHESVAVPGQVAMIPSGYRHRESATGSTMARVIWLEKRTDLAPLDSFRVFAPPPLLRHAAKELCDRPADALDAATRRALGRALGGMLGPWSANATSLVLPRARSPRLRRALGWLRARLDRPVGLPDGAKAGDMSERTLQRRCRAELDMSLSVWMGRARMLSALEHLSNPALPIAQVALHCGYQSPAAFTRAFSVQLGRTPSAWRALANAE
jgi:AraC-like DNA-binding protein